MSVIVKNNFVMGGGGGASAATLMDVLTNSDFVLDLMAESSEEVANNPEDYQALLGCTVTATINNASLSYYIVDLARYDKADGSGKAGFVLMPSREVLTTHRMNASNTTSGGWASTEMRSWLNGLTRPSQAVQVKVPYVNGTGTTVSYANDYLFLPSYGELFGKYNSGNRSVEGDLFAGATNSGTWRVRYSGTSAVYYWLRSVYDSGYFWRVYTDGGAYSNLASNAGGVVPCFCI